ncbi:MAG: hypothetical protein ACHP9T_06685 [Caulobacterales bacterium]
MTVKSIVLAGATLLALAAPAAALADPEWGHDHGRHRGWGDGDERRGGEWRDRGDRRGDEWREREGWDRGGYGWAYRPRCFIENRGFYNWYGAYVYRPVRVCR